MLEIILLIVSILIIALVLLQGNKASDAGQIITGGNDSLFKNRKERGGELFITYTTVVLGKQSNENLVQKVEVIPIDMNNVVAIIVTDKGHVEHKNIYIQESVDSEEIKKTVDLINKLIIGTSINLVSEVLEYQVKPIIGNYVKSHETLYQAFYNAFNEFSFKGNMHMAGRTKLLDYREFDNTSKIKEILNK